MYQINALERKYKVAENGNTQEEYFKVVLKNCSWVNCTYFMTGWNLDSKSLIFTANEYLPKISFSVMMKSLVDEYYHFQIQRISWKWYIEQLNTGGVDESLVAAQYPINRGKYKLLCCILILKHVVMVHFLQTTRSVFVSRHLSRQPLPLSRHLNTYLEFYQTAQYRCVTMTHLVWFYMYSIHLLGLVPSCTCFKQRDQERPVVEARSLTTRTSATRKGRPRVKNVTRLTCPQDVNPVPIGCELGSSTRITMMSLPR